jgi:hypothetical protein
VERSAGGDCALNRDWGLGTGDWYENGLMPLRELCAIKSEIIENGINISLEVISVFYEFIHIKTLLAK